MSVPSARPDVSEGFTTIAPEPLMIVPPEGDTGTSVPISTVVPSGTAKDIPGSVAPLRADEIVYVQSNGVASVSSVHITVTLKLPELSRLAVTTAGRITVGLGVSPGSFIAVKLGFNVTDPDIGLPCESMI
jgi:hypothetical protein